MKIDFEDKLDYLVENTQGIINDYIRDLINEYYNMKYKKEDLEEYIEMYKQHSRPLTTYEETGMRESDF